MDFLTYPRKVPVDHETRVNLVFVTDVHLAAKPIGRRQDTYADEILGKLEWTGQLAAKLRGAVVCGGDLFHVKNPRSDSNPLGFIRRVLTTLQGFPTGCAYGAVGNHDITADNLNSLADQPMGLLMASGAYCDEAVVFESNHGLANAIRVLVKPFNYVNKEDLHVAIQEHSAAVRAEMESFEANQLDWDEKPWHYVVAVVHAFNKVGRTEMMFGADLAIGHDDLKDTVYNAVLWGHDHARKGIIVPADGHGPTHVQLGSLARAAWASDEIDRPVAAAVLSFDFEGMKIVEKDVPVKPLTLAFHTADIQIDKVERREDVTEFLAGLEAHADAVDSEDPMEILQTLTDDATIIQTIADACELIVPQPAPAP